MVKRKIHENREKIFFQIVSEIGIALDRTKKFPWLKNKITDSDKELWEIFIALDGNPAGMKQKGRRTLKPDGYLPEYNCIIEFDELQHFTSHRRRTFEYYPANIPLGYEIDAYRAWCDEHADSAIEKGASGYRVSRIDFQFEGGRAAQRALFDACRDILAPQHCLEPTIRISEFQIPSLLNNRTAAAGEVEMALANYLK